MLDENAPMLERVARALCEAQGQNPDRSVNHPVRIPGSDVLTVDMGSSAAWVIAIPQARAVLLAMRTPLTSMDEGKAAVWRGAIDDALAQHVT